MAQYSKLQVLKPVGSGIFLIFVLFASTYKHIIFGQTIFQPVVVVFYHSQQLFPRVDRRLRGYKGLRPFPCKLSFIRDSNPRMAW